MTGFFKVFVGVSICFAFSVNGISQVKKAEPAKKPVPVSDKKEKKEMFTNLPDNILLIIGKGKTRNYYVRVREIYKLGKNLPQNQIDALYEFLYNRLEDQELRNRAFNGLKNETVEALMKQRQKPKELSAHLVKMYKDKTFDPTWRDYCVQFFGKWYEKAPNNAGKKAMYHGLFDAVEERKGSIGGTAVTMMRHLVHLPEFDKKEVADLAYKLITSPDCSNSGKISGLQVCADLGDKRALPLAREWVEKSKNKFIKMSAMAAIGTLGDRSDLPLLEKYSSSTDIRLRGPAVAAIKKIKRRSS